MIDLAIQRELDEDGTFRRPPPQHRCACCMTSLLRTRRLYRHVAANDTRFYTCGSHYCIRRGTALALHPMRFDDINDLLRKIRAKARSAA